MARIRTIKPEFWSDDKLGPLDALTRLVFIGLVSQADDAGRLPDSVKRLNGLLFPFTDEDCGPCLELLSTLGVISRGLTANGQAVIQIVGWQRHQKIEKPNLRAALPPIVPPSKVRRRVADDSGNGSGGVPDVSPGEVEGEVEVEGIGTTKGASRAREGSASPDFTPNDEHRAFCKAHRLDVGVELIAYQAWNEANNGVVSDATFTLWLTRSVSFGGSNAQPEPPPRPAYAPVQPEKPISEEDRAEVARMSRETLERLKPPDAGSGHGRLASSLGPRVKPTVEDPEVIRRRAEEAERQRKIAQKSMKLAGKRDL